MVTGEAVVLELREAKLPSRAVARVIDIVVQYIVRFGLLILQSAGSGATSQPASQSLTGLQPNTSYYFQIVANKNLNAFNRTRFFSSPQLGELETG